MLQIDTLTLGLYQVNCYIVSQPGSKVCCVIDPGYEPETILDYLDEKGLTPEAVLLTHGHFDHVGGVRTLAAEYEDCQVYLCSEDLIMPPNMTDGPLYYTTNYREGTCLDIAGIHWQVMQTPGHTPGSVCLFAEDCLFSGDTLFDGSCGRTDLPCGDSEAILNSLHRLSQLEGDYRVFPGHGNSTTLALQKQYNPYLR